MWNRLKNSLSAAAISAAIVLGFGALAEPIETGAPADSPSFLVKQENDAEAAQRQLAIQVLAKLTALAIDAALDKAPAPVTAAEIKAKSEQAVRQQVSRSLRMPFYSFGQRLQRGQES